MDKTVSREDVNGSNFNNQGINGVPDNSRTTGTTGSAHSHNFTTSSCIGCNNSAFKNRPPYYTLAFIYKL